MAFAPLPEGYVSPGYVIVSIFTPEGKDAVINVYGMYDKKEAVKAKRRMVTETQKYHTDEEMKQWSLFVRKVADIDQMNRLLEAKDA